LGELVLDGAVHRVGEQQFELPLELVGVHAGGGRVQTQSSRSSTKSFPIPGARLVLPSARWRRNRSILSSAMGFSLSISWERSSGAILVPSSPISFPISSPSVLFMPCTCLSPPNESLSISLRSRASAYASAAQAPTGFGIEV
jgi:hypothetical protein